MALDRLRELGFYVVAIVDDQNRATITIAFQKAAVDLDSGTVGNRDILTIISVLDEKIREAGKVVAGSG